MSIKQSQAKVRFWQQFTPEQKSQILSERAKKMWAKRTPEERKAHGKHILHVRKLNQALKSG